MGKDARRQTVTGGNVTGTSYLKGNLAMCSKNLVKAYPAPNLGMLALPEIQPKTPPSLHV